jgi:hypothetical protein
VAVKSSIVPIGSAPAEQVIDYLVGEGVGRGLTPEEARWKYFDEEFNQGRNRGFAWLSKGRVRGFIGCIPAVRATPVGDREMIWTCDWSVEDPEGSPGIGILLLSKVHKSTEFTGGVGGSADTHSLVPRMTTRSVRNAAVTLRRPLRLGALLERAEKKFSILPQLSKTRLGNLSLPARKSPAGVPRPMSTHGVAVESLSPLFDRPAREICRVRYDARHLGWLGRYPGAEFRSIHVVDGSDAAGALLWRMPREPSGWRFAIRHTAGATGLLDAVAAQLVEELRQTPATIVSALLSSHDAEFLRVLRRHGFIEAGGRLPLYIPELDGPAGCSKGFADMSYLDTDLAFIH